VRFVVGGARLFGTRADSDLVKTMEGNEEALYDAQDGPDVAAIAADEREHAAIWQRLDAGMPGITDGDEDASDHEGASDKDPSVAVVALPGKDRPESWHRAGRSGALRAAIFGINDGLVSNLALVMGVAGASQANQLIVLAGVAGLLAGAFSMAAGEYISMRSQRELFERQIELERAELEAMPDEEQRELVEIYIAKGLPPEEAERVAEKMFRDPQTALDTLVREELGLDPDELGSPWGAAFGSFAAFAVGAVIPVLPYLLMSGTAAFALSLGLSLVALFAVGAAVSLLTGKGVLFSGLRQLAIGAAAAAVTYAVGTVIGVGVAG
jgi:VIT1/CCC1 family predicted Fe2+/Mn2+ transporter